MALEARCAAMESEVHQLERRLIQVNDKIEAAIKRLPKRPGINGDQLRAEVRSIDTKVTTTSMKLVEEKTLLRRKDNIKARLKELAAYESALQEVQALKDQRAVLAAEKRDKGTQMAEMRQGLRRLRLAERLGVAPRDLAQESIEVPREAIGRVIGKRRVGLAQLEEECGVSLTEEHVRFESVGPQRHPGSGDTYPGAAFPGSSGGSGSAGRGSSSSTSSSDALVLHISGTREGVAEARRRLDLTIRTTEVIVKASTPLAAALRASRRALLLRLEEELRVKIFVGSAVVVPPFAPFAPGADADGGGGGGTGTSGNGGDSGGSSRSDCGRGGHQALGRGEEGVVVAAGATALATRSTAVKLTVRGLPEDVEAARIQLTGLDCTELVVPVERKSLSAIFGCGGANLQRMESDYSVFLDVMTGMSRVVLMGVRADVEAAAEKIREISHEFRETEERWPVQPYQVTFLLRNRGAELRAMAHRVGGGVMINIVDKRNASSTVTVAAAPTVPEAPSSEPEGGVHGHDEIRKEGGETATEGAKTTSIVWVRGSATRVSAAGALLLERLQAAERLTAKVAIPGEAVATFVGHAGSEIRKLRRLCVGCELGLSSVVGGVAEVSLLANDEASLAASVSLVRKWVRHQQVRVLTVGSGVAALLRGFRAAGVRDRITGADRRQGAAWASGGGGGGGGGGASGNDGGRAGNDAGAGVDEDNLFRAVHMDIVVSEGVVRLRGGYEELDRAERLVKEFQADNWTTETPVATGDEEVLLRRSLLRDMQAKLTDVSFQYLRERAVVVARGRRERAESAAALLQEALHGGGGLNMNRIAPFAVSLVPLAPSGMTLVTSRGRFHLKRLSAETGTEMDPVPAASVVRIRAPPTDTAAVAKAKRSLLHFVGSHQAEIFVDLALAREVSGASWPLSSFSPSGVGGRRGAKSGAAPGGAMEAATGSDDNDGGVDGGGDGGVYRETVAKKAAVARTMSNKVIRRTVKLHGCEVEFVAAPSLSVTTKAIGSSDGSGANGNGNGSNGAGAGSGADKHRHNPQRSSSTPSRQDVGRGAGGGAAKNASDTPGMLSAATGVGGVGTGMSHTSAPKNVQSRWIRIRGPPGLVEKARDALVALVLGRADDEIAVIAAALGAGSWRTIQDSSASISITPDKSRCSLRVCGPPAEVETCRRELYTMLGSVFRGQFVAVPVLREALHEVANSLSLADAAAAAAAAAAATIPRDNGGREAAAAAVAETTAEILGPVGAAAAACGWRGEPSVQLLADWPCSCIRVRGDVAAVRAAVDEIHKALSKWSALEVTADVEKWMEPALYGKQGKAIKKLSQSMGGIVLNVVDGVCRGRAKSVEEARDATIKLQDRVNELRARRAVIQVPQEVVSRLTSRSGPNIEKLQDKASATIEIEAGAGGNEVVVSGDPAAVAATEREVLALTRARSTSGPAARTQQEELNPCNAPLTNSDGLSQSCSSSQGSSRREGTEAVTPPPLSLPSKRQHTSNGAISDAVDDRGRAHLASRPGREATESAEGSVNAEAGTKLDGDRRRTVEDQQQVAEMTPPEQAFTPFSGAGSNSSGGSGSGSGSGSSGSFDPICFGSFEGKVKDPSGSGDPRIKTDCEPRGPSHTVHSGTAMISPWSKRDGSGDRHKRVSAATEAEAERLFAYLLLVDKAAASVEVEVPSSRTKSSPRQCEDFPIATTTIGVSNSLRQPPSTSSQFNRSDTVGHGMVLTAASGFGVGGGGNGKGASSSACCAVPSSSRPLLQPPAADAAPARIEGYFMSSSGIRIRL